MSVEEVDASTWRRQLMSWWRRRNASPNIETPVERQDSRAVSQEMVETDPIAGGAIDVNVAHVVGTGLSMRANIDAEALGITEGSANRWQDIVNRRFEMFATSRLCDAGERDDFYGLQQLALRSWLTSGDVFTHLPLIRRPDWPFRMAVQLIEADLVCNPQDGADIQGQRVDGVDLNEFGAPVAAHIASAYRNDPVRTSGTGRQQRTWRRIEFVGSSGRRRLLHAFERKRPGQVRGRPYLLPVICKIKELSRYSEAEIGAAVSAAMLLAFTKMDPKAFEELFGNTEDQRQQLLDMVLSRDRGLKPNTIVNLLPGEEIQVPANQRANASFDAFFRAVVQQIAVGLELPFEVLMRRFESSYTASRAALLEAGRTFRRRRDDLAKWFCQPIYEEWLADEVALGNIRAPGFFEDPYRRWLWTRCQWVGDGPGVLDPLKEVQASAMLIKEGLSTREAESIKFDGVPWDVKHRQLAVERKMRVEDDLEPETPEPVPPGGASARPPQAASRTNPDTPDPADQADD